jgi:hypothetical protein
MRPFFQLFDLESGNVIAQYDEEHDAWETLRATAREQGPEALRGLGLMRMHGDDLLLIAMDDELVQRALGEAPLPVPAANRAQ